MVAATLIADKVNAEALRGLSLEELRYLSEALRTVQDVTTALTCQPRFEGKLPGGYNAAGEQLEAIYETLLTCLDAIRAEAIARTATNMLEAENRANLLILSEANCFDDFDDLVILAATLQRDIAGVAERGEISR